MMKANIIPWYINGITYRVGIGEIPKDGKWYIVLFKQNKIKKIRWSKNQKEYTIGWSNSLDNKMLKDVICWHLNCEINKVLKNFARNNYV